MNRYIALLLLTLLPSTALAEVKTVVYKTTPTGKLEMHIHFPEDWKASDKRPAIVFFFGGGWTKGTAEQFEGQAAHLASRGMVAARADYRVKSRHQGITPVDCVEDAKSAVRYLREHQKELGINPDKIVSSGGSAGGHIAACTGLCPGLDAKGEDTKISSQPNAMVLFNPVMRFAGIEKLETRLGDDIAQAKAISPTLHVKKDSPPSLLLYGTSDRLIEQGKEYVAAATKAGCTAEWMSAPDAGHGFFNRPPWYEKTLQRMDQFLVSQGYLEKP